MTSTTDKVGLPAGDGGAGSRLMSPSKGGGRRQRGGTFAAWTFLVPNMILVGVFLLLPLVLAIVISFQKRESLGAPEFLGLNNYLDLVKDSVFWESLWNTVLFTVCTVPVGMALGLGIAHLLNGLLPGRTLYRSIIFLPLVISGVATGVLGAWMFDQYNGFVNNLLAVMGINGPSWQSSGGWAMFSVILMTLWQRVGFDMLIYLAGLQGIGQDVLEAASIDGATGWQRFRRVSFPLLGPSTFFLLIMNLIYSFQIFDTVFAMTAGGPDYSTTMLVTYAYRTGFDEHGPGELGYASTIGVIIFLITLLITVIQWRSSNTRDQVG